MLTTLAIACGDDDSPGGDDGGDTPDAGVGSPDAEPEPVIQCDTPVPAAADGACDFEAGSNGAVLVRGTVLAANQTFLDGSLLIGSDGDIACVGCDCADEADAADAARVDCGGATISPGLINPHEHMTFSENAPAGHGTTRYDHRHGWRGSISTPQNQNGTGGNANGTRWVEIRNVMGGATSMVGSGAANGMVRNLDRGDASALGLPESADFDTFPLGDAGEAFRADCGWNFGSTDEEVAGKNAYMPHVAEGHRRLRRGRVPLPELVVHRPRLHPNRTSRTFTRSACRRRITSTWPPAAPRSFGRRARTSTCTA